jgi:hypothetical protein
LEGKIYSIKRVTVQLKNVDESNIREKLRNNAAYRDVLALSKTDAKDHILRYYNAWFEAA